MLYGKSESPTSVPSHVFEVHIGGNPHQAITKLKRATKLWNSKIYIVISEDNKDLQKINELVNGTFPEIRGKLTILPINKLDEFHRIAQQYHKIKDELRLKDEIRL